MSLVIDENFIEERVQLYSNDPTIYDKDDVEYKELIEEIKKDNKITKCIFRGICIWKSNGGWQWNKYIKHGNFESDYKDFINAAASQPNISSRIDDMLFPQLTGKKNGINFVYAITILHFFYPDEMPVIDKNTMKALKNISTANEKQFQLYENYINSNNFKELKNLYMGYFMSSINDIRKKTGKSFREIDKALFYEGYKNIK